MIEGQLRSKIGYMSEPMCFCTSRYCQVCEESHKIVKFNMKPWYANNLLAYISSLLVFICRIGKVMQIVAAAHASSPPNLPSSVFSRFLASSLARPFLPGTCSLSLFLSRWSPPSRPLFLLSSYVWHSECLTERPPTLR